jgi:GntR family transcriptional regulator
MIFNKPNPASGLAIYLQLMEQIKHAIEVGAVRPGDQLPGIRTLAEQLVISPNTVAKAYSELQHEGVLELRHGSGAYIAESRHVEIRRKDVHQAQAMVRDVVETLCKRGFREDEIRRLFEAAFTREEALAR